MERKQKTRVTFRPRKGCAFSIFSFPFTLVDEENHKLPRVWLSHKMEGS